MKDGREEESGTETEIGEGEVVAEIGCEKCTSWGKEVEELEGEGLVVLVVVVVIVVVVVRVLDIFAGSSKKLLISKKDILRSQSK